MKAATISQIKKELHGKSTKQLLDLILRLGKFKKDNKELLTYLLFEAEDEQSYISHIKEFIDEGWNEMNLKSYYWVNKSIRKILRAVKKFIRYSQKKETEVELLLYFCKKLKNFNPYISRSSVLKNIMFRELNRIEKSIQSLHEDLQFDYQEEIQSEFGI